MAEKTFASLKVGLASPERILEWSYGKVTKPETINYRSGKPEKDGLFCEKIFGPVKDWECACGKYKKVRYKGVVCDRCGVEITKSSVRRERMGHIELAAPVTHIWYLKGSPYRMALLLDIGAKSLEEVIYFVKFVVINPGKSNYQYKQVISEDEYRAYSATGDKEFDARMGAEAIQTLLQQVDLEAERKKILEDLDKVQAEERRKKLIKRLETMNAFINSGNKPEWMCLTVLPVIPPELRPMLSLDGGRYATSDLNDLYRRVITRNNRLKKLIDIQAPAIILQNEKRMLQEAVDALIDNGRRTSAVKGSGSRDLKSLSHSLKGKQGRFRQNLLGKRVDFSGRSVIAVGPDLKMYQCGLPREMAIQLYKPFVMNELVNNKTAQNSKTAEKMIERGDSQIWDALEQVMENHPVFLNRAPTLHRLGIQAFKPKLVEGRAIRLHPLVCTGFNADFDGDQMAVHLPLSEKAIAESEVLMLASNNILGPKDGKPIVTPSQDMVLGNFYLNMEESADEFYAKADKFEKLGDSAQADMWRTFGDNEGHIFMDFNEVQMAYADKKIHLHTRIAVYAGGLNKTCFSKKQNNSYLVTTTGKLIFNSKFPADFPYINNISVRVYDKKDPTKFKEVISESNLKETPDSDFLPLGTDVKAYIASQPVRCEFKKKDLGKVIEEVFNRYSIEGSSSILDDIKDLGFQYSTVAGMTVALADIDEAPHKEEIIKEADSKTDELKKLLDRGHLTKQEWDKHFQHVWNDAKEEIGDDVMKSLERMNPINMMAVSGARGNKSHFTQLAGMRGLMARPMQSKSRKEYQSGVIEVPIKSSFRHGLNVSEFFISTHGVRKGLTDTALKTAESGYLTRRLVDVAQDVIITDEDCGTKKGFYVSAMVNEKDSTIVYESFFNRIVGRFTKEDVFDPKTGELIIASDEFIDEETAEKIVNAGIEGIHIRNTFTCNSINGLCRKCYGRNMATGKLVESGEAVGIMAAQSIGEPGTQLTMRTFHTGGVASGDDSDITQGLPRVEELFEARGIKRPAVLALIAGEITGIDNSDSNRQTITITNETETKVHECGSQVLRSDLKTGLHVNRGDRLTEGNIDTKKLIELAGPEAVENYILREVKKVYWQTGIDISDKHIEIIIKQMLKRVVITDPGDSDLCKGQTVLTTDVVAMNKELDAQGLAWIDYSPKLQGISKASVETESFLSAASFQETTRVLTEAVIFGKEDHLRGLKENVIIGKLIPAGTGSKYARETTERINVLAEEMSEERRERTAELEAEKNEKSAMPAEILNGGVAYEDDVNIELVDNGEE